MNMEPVRFGVIGCGLMGREFASVSMRWLHLACELPRPVIVAACDLSPKNLDWFRQVPDTKYFYSDYHELLANPEVEAVYCAVPHHLHAQVYGDVIRAGKHLIGEKPFGMDLAACEEVEGAMAGRPEVFVRCASEFPFYPAVQQMVKWYREGAFGQIIEARFAIKHSSDMDLAKPINWRRMRAATENTAVWETWASTRSTCPSGLVFRPAPSARSLPISPKHGRTKTACPFPVKPGTTPS
ncbi:MAG: Gfo/Idh/MocA family protein [Ruthenibacterium lactatiformans]